MGKEGRTYGLFIVADNKRSAVIVGVRAEEVEEVGNLALKDVIFALKRANGFKGSSRSRVLGKSVDRREGKRAGANIIGIFVGSGHLVFR